MCFKRPRETMKLGERIATTFSRLYNRGQNFRREIKRLRKEIYPTGRPTRRLRF